MPRSDAPVGGGPDEPGAWHPDVERLFAALPDLRAAIEEAYGGWAEHASFLIQGGGFGRHLNALLGSEARSASEDARRAFAFLEELARDGLDALERGEDRHRHDLAIEALEAVSFAHLGRAYLLMGPATRAILEEMAAWNEFAREQARLGPERWNVENIEAFREAYRQAAGTLPEPPSSRSPETA